MKVLRLGDRSRASRLCVLATVPFFVAIATIRSEAQTKAYVVQTSANTVTVIDTATGTVTGAVEVGTSPARVAINRDGTRAYVTNGGAGIGLGHRYGV